MPWLKVGSTSPNLLLFCESYYTNLNFNWSVLKGLRSREWKYILAPTKELFHLAGDPEETKNLFPLMPDQGQNYEADLRRLEKEMAADLAGSASSQSRLWLEAETRQKLKSLGYLCASPSVPKPDQILADPKDMIHVLKAIEEGQTLYAQGSLEKSALQYEKIIEHDPENIFLHYTLGVGPAFYSHSAISVGYRILGKSYLANPSGLSSLL